MGNVYDGSAFKAAANRLGFRPKGKGVAAIGRLASKASSVKNSAGIVLQASNLAINTVGGFFGRTPSSKAGERRAKILGQADRAYGAWSDIKDASKALELTKGAKGLGKLKSLNGGWSSSVTGDLLKINKLDGSLNKMITGVNKFTGSKFLPSKLRRPPMNLLPVDEVSVKLAQTASRAAKMGSSLSKVAKVAGPVIGIVSGSIDAVTSGTALWKGKDPDGKELNKREKAANWVKLGGGVATVVGSVMLFTPLAPLGAVLVGAGTAASLVSTVMELPPVESAPVETPTSNWEHGSNSNDSYNKYSGADD